MTPVSHPASKQPRRLPKKLIWIAILVVISLWVYSDCTGTATTADLTDDRAIARATARVVLPAIAHALDAEITGSRGEYRGSGAKTISFYDYGITTRMSAAETKSEEEFTTAFEAAGLKIRQTPGPENNYTIIGVTGEISVLCAIGDDDDDDPNYRFTLKSPSRKMAPNQKPSISGVEPLDLG